MPKANTPMISRAHAPLFLLFLGTLFSLTACVEGDAQAPDASQDGIPETPDGQVKTFDEKSDAWNTRNDPRGFRTALEYGFEVLPREGRTSSMPWTASYWPYFQDGINYRWQGKGILSPAEKYDKAFNAWTPEPGFMDLRPFDETTCTWDDAYYQQLGPAAAWTSKNKGNALARNGKDDDKDGIADADECTLSQPDSANEVALDGVETWWGICHAWAPAALVEPEPLAAVTRNGVTFDVSDQKGLIIQQWDKASAYLVGDRCNAKELERDATGRLTDPSCQDINAGSWHVLVTNFIGLNKKGLVIERIASREIWNQPLFGYKVTTERPITLEQAHELLGVKADASGQTAGNGTFVQGIEEESAAALALLDYINRADYDTLRASGLWNSKTEDLLAHRNGPDGVLGGQDDDLFDTVQELDDLRGFGRSTLAQLVRYASANGYGPDSKRPYAYNAQAVAFVEIHMTTEWLTEQHQSSRRTDTIIDRYTKNDRYHYILELDVDGKIIGGEWLGSSREEHPDFLWTPRTSHGGNPSLDTALIRDIIREGRESVLGSVTTDTKTFTKSEVLSIPDNDADGVISRLELTESGAIQAMRVDVSIAHTYRGDLLLELRHGGLSFTVFDGRTVSDPGRDDLRLTGLPVEGFEGANLQGTWELVVVDMMGQDVGTLDSWSLHMDVKQ